jgi:hypothetical protein
MLRRWMSVWLANWLLADDLSQVDQYIERITGSSSTASAPWVSAPWS